jgi:hypothetical protein
MMPHGDSTGLAFRHSLGPGGRIREMRVGTSLYVPQSSPRRKEATRMQPAKPSPKYSRQEICKLLP